MDDDGMDPEIAAAMGFSSFGGPKKRKYDQANSPKPKQDASGANSTKLGVRPKIATDEEVAENFTNNMVQTTNPQPMKGRQKHPAATGLAAFLSRGQNLPENPPGVDATQAAAPSYQDSPTAAEMVSFGGLPISRAELNVLKSGVEDENGDMAYFLPSFVEGPWDKLKTGRK